jgi:hypothetical protein
MWASPLASKQAEKQDKINGRISKCNKSYDPNLCFLLGSPYCENEWFQTHLTLEVLRANHVS